MKRNWAIAATLAAGLTIFEPGCKDSNSVTGTAPPTPVPTAVPLRDVSGAWTGAVFYNHGDFWFKCDPTATAVFTQTQSSVTGTVRNNCFEQHFQGTLAGGTLNGTSTVDYRHSHFTGTTLGTVAESWFSLSTTHLEDSSGGHPGFSVSLSR